ncbi:CHAT domain-containing protein [Bradyrhizobium sp. CCBAU 11430]|uniref:CHAT domain-containing protein n=1 Tax=Bradyrhizobium sp. CCBAU 11430 TaxID=1630881 RepID=UPI002306CC60|nr:CHAT domain-containing protein [Bradyrhizobium sp. CCBAU 11430]
MKSLWLRVEQLDRDNGRISLFDAAFPKPEDTPLVAEVFPLARLSARDWLDRETAMAAPGVPVGVFDDYGDELFGLLNQSVLTRWEAQRQNGTRTYLEVRRHNGLPDVRQLADLRWEYLGKKVPGGLVERHFADLQRPMLRGLIGTGSPAAPLSGQLNALVVTGEAIDWLNGGFPGDDVGAVLREFQRSETLAHAELLQVPSLAMLEAAFDRLNPDIFHFTGHGELSPLTQKPALKINEAAPGQPWWWDTAGVFAFFSNRRHKPRLVILNACDGAHAPSELYSLLEALSACGVPAVIAAQAPIGQAVTAELSRPLYQQLLAGQPIDVALAKARFGIGQSVGGTGWHSRDWGLPVLSTSMAPEALFPAKPAQHPDPVQILRRCSVLKQFMRAADLPAPFVGLAWTSERWRALDALRRQNCLIIKGAPKGGKSWLAMRTLRDAIQIGHRVKYVAVCGGPTPAVNYLDLLSAIVEADATQTGSEVHGALDRTAFQEFVAERDAHNSVDRILDAFERGLQEITRNHEYTIVLDEFQRDGPVAEAFPASEFRTILLPFLSRIARNSIRNLRLIIVVREDLYDRYGLAALPDEPIELHPFKQSDTPMLFQELCRFYRVAKLDVLCQAAIIMVAEPQWHASKLETFGQMVAQAKVPVP